MSLEAPGKMPGPRGAGILPAWPMGGDWNMREAPSILSPWSPGRMPGPRGAGILPASPMGGDWNMREAPSILSPWSPGKMPGPRGAGILPAAILPFHSSATHTNRIGRGGEPPGAEREFSSRLSPARVARSRVFFPSRIFPSAISAQCGSEAGEGHMRRSIAQPK